MNAPCAKVQIPPIRTHPAASLYSLVHVIRERFAADVAPRAFGGVKAAVLQHNLTLADHHQWPTSHFCALKDVILHSLGMRDLSSESMEFSNM